MFGLSVPNFFRAINAESGRCTVCNLVLVKSDPTTVKHGDELFCSDQCFDRYWMRRRERKAA